MRPQPPNRTLPVLKIYALALLVAFAFYVRGFHKTYFAIAIGTWLLLVGYLKFRDRQ
jgi:hypothetical protein